jgi:hypothetical protein
MISVSRQLSALLATVVLAASAFADAALKDAATKASEVSVDGAPITAWVETAALGAGNVLAVGTPLREAADAAGTVIRASRAGDTIVPLRVEGSWTQVRVLPADSGRRPAASLAAPAPVVATAQPPAPEPVQNVVTPAPVAVAPAPAPVAAPTAPTAPAASAPVLLPEDYQAVRTFTGSLEAVTGFIWTTPPSRYELVDKDGYRLAFLDVSKLMKTVDLQSTLGRQVQVSGTVKGVRRGRDMLMSVDTLVLR